MPAGDIVVVAEAVALGEALVVKAEGVENSLGGSLGVKGGDPEDAAGDVVDGLFEGAADGLAHTGVSENSKNTQPLDIVDNQSSGGGKRGLIKSHKEEVLVDACQDSRCEQPSSGSLGLFTEGTSAPATEKRQQKKSKSQK